MKRAIALLLTVSAFGQNVVLTESDNFRFYFATYEFTLSAAPAVATLQAPALDTKRTYLLSAYLYCSVAATVTQERDGTAATTTAVTAKATNSKATSTATFYRSSNVGVGTVLTPIELTAGNGQSIGLTAQAFDRNFASAQNYTFRTNSVTGTCRISMMWAQK